MFNFRLSLLGFAFYDYSFNLTFLFSLSIRAEGHIYVMYECKAQWCLNKALLNVTCLTNLKERMKNDLLDLSEVFLRVSGRFV